MCVYTCIYIYYIYAAAKSLQSCPTLWDPIDGSLPGSPIPGILQARTLEWVAISFSNAWKWKVKMKSLSRVRLLATPWTVAYQAPPSMGFPSKSTRVACHCLLRDIYIYIYIYMCVCVCVCVYQIRSVAQSCPTLCNPMNVFSSPYLWFCFCLWTHQRWKTVMPYFTNIKRYNFFTFYLLCLGMLSYSWQHVTFS